MTPTDAMTAKDSQGNLIGLPSTFEVPLKTKNAPNDPVHVMLSATTRRDLNGDIVGFFGVGQVILSDQQISHLYADQQRTCAPVCVCTRHSVCLCVCVCVCVCVCECV